MTMTLRPIRRGVTTSCDEAAAVDNNHDCKRDCGCDIVAAWTIAGNTHT